MTRRVLTRLGGVAAAAAVVLTAAACGGGDPTPRDGGLLVVAGFYPLEYVAERVGGDRVTVAGLAPPGGHAHDRELTVRQAARISDADLVIHLSGFQPSVDAAVRAYAPDALDVAAVVPLRPAAAHGGHGGHGSADPHVWLDPRRLATVTTEVAARLAELDPAHAAGYAARADALRADLADLDAAYTDGLARCERREIVVAHAAFGYLADRYDLRQIAVAGLEPDAEPTPGRVIKVVELARSHGATTVFAEALTSPDVARLIAGELGARTATLDPVEGLTPGRDADYLGLMRANLAALKEGLGCA